MTTPESALREAKAHLVKAAVWLTTAGLTGEGNSPRMEAAFDALQAAVEAVEAIK